jgi:peptidoglycan/xylan/chitin deacetylase (PgdA/CDA1 family)
MNFREEQEPMLHQPNKKKVAIFMYHSISDHAATKFRQFTVSPALFADHVAYLHQQTYTPLTVNQFVHALSHGSSAHAALPERPVLLTFDDGFADFFTDALPVLKQYNFTATLYVATAFVNGTSLWLQREGEMKRHMVTWEQLAEISALGIECGSHGHRHLQLDTLPPRAVQQEIVQSKRLLEQHLGRSVASFAYPFGYYTARVRQQVQEAGYTSACAVKHALSSEKTDPFALARLMVKADTSISTLAALLDGHRSSVATKFYLRTRTPTWQLVRRASASVRRYVQGGQPVQ